LAEGEGWRRLGSERLMENPYFSLRSDRLRLPDGGVKDPYYVIERPDAAIVFPLTADQKEVILVSQYRPPLEMMELGLPAGLVEEGERPEEAARRELVEVVRVPVKELPNLVHTGKIVSSSGVAAIMLALERLREDP